MAHLQQIKRKHGSAWRIVYYENGVRKSLYLPCGTKQQALAEKYKVEQVIKLKEAQRATGNFNRSHGIREQREITIDEFYTLYEAERKTEIAIGSLAAETLKRQLYPLRLFREMISGRLMSSLSPQDLENFKRSRAEKITAYGANKDLINLKISLRWAYKKEILPTPIYDHVEQYKVEKKLPKYFEPHEIDLIEKFVTPEIALFAFRVIKYTGIRRTELTRITWANVHENYIELPHTKTRLQRTIPMHKRLADLLEERRRIVSHRPEERLVAIDPDTLTKYLNRAIKSAGFDAHKKAVHIFRHSLGSYLAASGFGLNEIAQILGHETLHMAKLYSQIPKKAIKEKLDNLWGEK